MQASYHIRREQLQHFHMEHYHHLGCFFHFHSQIELLLVRRGHADVWIRESGFRMGENELAVVLGYEAHQFRAEEEGGEYTSLFIPGFLCPEFTETVRNKTVRRPIIRDREAMAQITSAVDRLGEAGLNSVEQTGWLHVILGTVLAQLELQELALPQADDLPAKLLYYINGHYREDISAESIAQAFGYSADHLARSFRASFQIGIGKYINTLRLGNAVMLMRENRMSITECALESGFGSLRTFYRVFEGEFGCSPREYLGRT